jgi:hypothetical protein
VQLQERRGTWARISTASGQVGYVHTKFLRVLEDNAQSTAAIPPTESPVVPTVTAASSPPPTAPPTLRATSTRRAPTQTRAATAQQQQASPTELHVAEDPSPTPTGTAKVEPPARRGNRDIQQEIDRLSGAIEALNSRLDQRFPLPEDITTATTVSSPSVSGGAILLGVLGVILGWLLGATYQRNKDRGRRSRIRL